MCKSSPVVKQFLAILCCNILSFSFGLCLFWTTINLMELKSANSTFPTGPITDEQSSIYVSIGNIGGLMGNFVILPTSQFIGVKNTIHLLCVPMILGTTLLIFATNVYYLYVSRVLFGIVGGALVVGIPSLVNDVSFDRVRGALNSLYDPFYNLGIITTFIIGSILPCMTQAKIQLIPTAIFAIVMFFLPESPEFWRNQNQREEANKSRKFYKGSIFGSIFGSMAAIERRRRSGFISVPQNENTISIEKGKEKPKNVRKSESSITFKDFCTPHAKRALSISVSIVTLGYLTGTLTLLAYITQIFNETGSMLSEKQSAILISFTQLTGNIVLLNIVERFNRKTLYICSSLLTAVAYFMFGAYGYFEMKQLGYSWMPPLCLACIIFSACMGLLPMPYIISIEIFPQKIRPVCLSLVVSILWILLFILSAVFNTFLESFGLFNCMFGLSVICILNAIFGIFFLVETRGKSFEEIEKMMSGGNDATHL